jgi:hypothetical protein
MEQFIIIFVGMPARLSTDLRREPGELLLVQLSSTSPASSSNANSAFIFKSYLLERRGLVSLAIEFQSSFSTSIWRNPYASSKRLLVPAR